MGQGPTRAARPAANGKTSPQTSRIPLERRHQIHYRGPLSKLPGKERVGGKQLPPWNQDLPRFHQDLCRKKRAPRRRNGSYGLLPYRELVMSNHIVNDLIESLANAPGKKREPIQVGRLLAFCQQKCPEWFHECESYDREEWIELLIRPRQVCEHWDGGCAC